MKEGYSVFTRHSLCSDFTVCPVSKMSSRIFLREKVLIQTILLYLTDEKRVDKGHKIKLSNDGKPQRVFGKVDANNVALTMQGPGTASVTSHLKAGTQTVVFDPMPPEPCPDHNCPQPQGFGKRHMRKN